MTKQATMEFEPSALRFRKYMVLSEIDMIARTLKS